MKLYVTIYCILLATIVNSLTTAKAQVNVNDSLALVDLYNSTNGSSWTHKDNWLTSAPVSTWYGLFFTDSRVTDIELGFNNLAGTLPASLGNMKHLVYLYLQNNQLSGSIPFSIGNLISLQEIYLNTNQLSGAIPSSFGNLVNVTTLFLYQNQLSGAIPASIGNLVKSINFDLSYNLLTDSIPSSFGNFTTVNYFNIQHNQLTGSIPATIGNLKKVHTLFLSNNQLTDSIPASLGNLKHLVYLYLQNNQLSGSIPESFRKLQALSLFDFSHNQLTQTDYVDFPMAVNHGLIGNISYNRFTFIGLETIAQRFHKVTYAPQASLSIHQDNITLSLSAGGTLSNNTYKWYKAGGVNPTTIKGDSTFTPSTSGKYYAYVTNSIASKLTLATDTFTYTVPLQSNSIASSKIISHHFSFYPNPTSNIIHIQTTGTATITITNSAGKVLLSKSMNNSGDINVSAFTNGVYYLQNNATGEIQKVVVIH